MVNFQAQWDALSAALRDVRSGYHLTLGELLDTLAGVHEWTPVIVDRGGSVRGFRSYRGYYEDLALEPAEVTITAGSLRREAAAAEGHTFEGYKGGDFTMGRDAPLWIATYGSASGLAIVGIAVGESPVDPKVRLITKLVDR
ncbi:MAG: hypothetical protein F4Y94_08610 [Chloroflexi bacterium]|nr:hypothetical protein [Chloroflexota bacterium]